MIPAAGRQRRIQALSLATGLLVAALAALPFALGCLRQKVARGGAELAIFDLDRQTAENLLWWDRARLAELGWHTAENLQELLVKATGLPRWQVRSWLPALLATLCLGLGASAGAGVFLAGWALHHRRHQP